MKGPKYPIVATENGLVKTCTQCGETKAIGKFASPPCRKGNFTACCISCERVRCKNWAQSLTKDKRARRLAYHKACWVRLRTEILTAYGGKCKCCGESTYEFLAIDHINNDGAEHRRKLGSNSVYSWLKKNRYPEGFQILCHNCNVAKAFYGGCPHRRITDAT